jgi:hypothetical protein
VGAGTGEWYLDLTSSAADVQVVTDDPFLPSLDSYWVDISGVIVDDDVDDDPLDWTWGWEKGSAAFDRTLPYLVWRRLGWIKVYMDEGCTRGTTDQLSVHGAEFAFKDDQGNALTVVGTGKRYLTPDCYLESEDEDAPRCLSQEANPICVQWYVCQEDPNWRECHECRYDSDCDFGYECNCGNCELIIE